MITEIRAPTFIVSGVKASIGRWFKRTSDPVTLREPLVEIMADQMTHELSAPATGVLSSIVLMDGQSVEPGSLLGTITTY
ncbi:MAG: hypothetical protein P4M05_28745 [Bradyrhizobium sp.]|nr:hypothetical protein [Bradyrhizobium sp.]